MTVVLALASAVEKYFIVTVCAAIICVLDIVILVYLFRILVNTYPIGKLSDVNNILNYLLFWLELADVVAVM